MGLRKIPWGNIHIKAKLHNEKAISLAVQEAKVIKNKIFFLLFPNERLGIHASHTTIKI